jgi:hypothetical protein
MWPSFVNSATLALLSPLQWENLWGSLPMQHKSMQCSKSFRGLQINCSQSSKLCSMSLLCNILFGCCEGSTDLKFLEQWSWDTTACGPLKVNRLSGRPNLSVDLQDLLGYHTSKCTRHVKNSTEFVNTFDSLHAGSHDPDLNIPGFFIDIPRRWRSLYRAACT